MNNNKNEQSFFQKNIKLILISAIFLIAIYFYFNYNQNINNVQSGGGKIISNKFVINNITELNNLLDSF